MELVQPSTQCILHIPSTFGYWTESQNPPLHIRTEVIYQVPVPVPGTVLGTSYVLFR